LPDDRPGAVDVVADDVGSGFYLGDEADALAGEEAHRFEVAFGLIVDRKGAEAGDGTGCPPSRVDPTIGSLAQCGEA
jgi:hypothetical protein